MLLLSILAVATGCFGSRKNRGRDASSSDSRQGDQTAGVEPDAGDETTGSGDSAAALPADYVEPEIWIHALIGSPNKGAEMGAKGIRGIVDMRKFNVNTCQKLVDTYASMNLGCCLTVRWMGSAEDEEDRAVKSGRRGERKAAIEGGRARVDTAPSASEGERARKQLMEVLTSPSAKKLGSKLWVQFYNEIAGGPGTIHPEDQEALFDWATETAKQIRREAPAVRICGPGLAGIDVLDKDDKSLDQTGKYRKDILLRAIRFSIQYGDAVDIHLHASGGDMANDELSHVRRIIDREGGAAKGIVVWEWSPARYPNRNDTEGVRKAIVDIWQAMAKYGVLHAAYGSYASTQQQSELYRWKALTQNGRPSQPFYQTFVEIADGKMAPARRDQAGD